MIINEEIRKELIENVNKNFKNITSLYMNFIYNLENAETVEDIVKFKQSFLVDYLHSIPLKANYCYFCLENPYCVACVYAKYHKNCNYGDSDWKKINDMRCDLMTKIDSEYYRGEEY